MGRLFYPLRSIPMFSGEEKTFDLVPHPGRSQCIRGTIILQLSIKVHKESLPVQVQASQHIIIHYPKVCQDLKLIKFSILSFLLRWLAQSSANFSLIVRFNLAMAIPIFFFLTKLIDSCQLPQRTGSFLGELLHQERWEVPEELGWAATSKCREITQLQCSAEQHP